MGSTEAVIDGQPACAILWGISGGIRCLGAAATPRLRSTPRLRPRSGQARASRMYLNRSRAETMPVA